MTAPRTTHLWTAATVAVVLAVLYDLWCVAYEWWDERQNAVFLEDQ